MRGGGHEADRAATQALVEQQHGAGAGVTLDVDARDAVAQFGGQAEARLDRFLAGLEIDALASDAAAVVGERARRISGRPLAVGALDAEDDAFAGEARRVQQQRLRLRPVHLHRDRPEALQRGHECVLVRRFDAVREPNDVGARIELDLAQRVGRGLAVDRPRLRRHRLEQRLGVGRAQQARRLDRHGRVLARRVHENDLALLAFGLLDHVGDERAALVPVRGRGPAVVDDEDQRSRGGEGAARIPERLREADDRERHD